MKRTLIIALMLLLINTALIAQNNCSSFYTSGDFIFSPPPGVTFVTAHMMGGGAGGNPFNGNGGGGGAYTQATFNISGKGNIYVHVAYGGLSADNGEASIISWDSAGVRVPLAIANGGNGLNGAGGSASPVIGNVTQSYAGGNGAAAFSSYFGGGGAAANTTSTGANAPGTSTFSCQIGGIGIVASGGNGSGPGCTATNGGTPGGGGGGGAGTAGGAGRVFICYDCPSPLNITGLTVPYPQENVIYPASSPFNSFRDSLTDENPGAVSPTGNGLVYSWESSPDGVNNWTDAVNTVNSPTYYMEPISQATWYRRKSNICNVIQNSNAVKVNVVRKDIVNAQNPLGSVGSITGYIVSKGLNPVKGDSVIARKRLNLNGSSKDFTYYAVTDNQGKFVLDSMFYGKYANNDGDPVNVSFYVKPVKYQHVFDITDSLFYDINLSASKYDVDVKNGINNYAFKDLSAVSIIGKTYQQCNDCLLPNGTTGPVQRDIDSIFIKVNGQTTSTRTGVVDGNHGVYTVSVDDITQNTRLTPDTAGFYTNTIREFDTTGSTILARDKDLLGVNFRDTNSYAISGKFRAGCGEIIGKAVLSITDIPLSPEREPVFDKRIITETNGNYTLRMPAGKYKVKMIDFIPAGSGLDLQKTNVINFFSGEATSTSIDPDLLVVDLRKSDATLNLTYQRPPTLQLVGWDSVCTIKTGPTAGTAYDVWKQLDNKTINVKVFQGVSDGIKYPACPLAKGNVTINTTIQTNGILETLTGPVNANATATTTFRIGYPNIAGDFTKSLSINYTDQYGNNSNLDRNVVVTGTRPRPGRTFRTQSPELPLYILHRPPGDKSFCKMIKSKKIGTQTSFIVKKQKATEGNVQVKVGTDFGLATGIGIEVSQNFAFWASGDFKWNSGQRNVSDTVLETYNEVVTEFATSDDPNQVGSLGDIFVTGATNYVYGTCDVVDYKDCKITSLPGAVIAPDSIETVSYYTKYDIETKIIATLEDDAKNPTISADSIKFLKNQISLWQNILDKNEANIKAAITNINYNGNITFTGSASPIVNTITSNNVTRNSTEFSLLVDSSWAWELGFQVSGSGLKGGQYITLNKEEIRDTTYSTDSSNSVLYSLDDSNSDNKFSVNIKVDSAYGTPVFETVGGESSCPPEPGTIALDEMALSVDVPQKVNQPLGTGYTFNFACTNTSIDINPRSYILYLDDNTDGAIINNGSTSYAQAVTNIPKNGVKYVAVTVARPNSTNASYSFKNLKFILADNCAGTNITNINPATSRVQLVSLDYANPCSNISLTEPENNFVSKQADNSILKIGYNGYTPANLLSVVLQYRITGTSTWKDATTTNRTAAQLTGSTSQLINWNVATLIDGKYDLRLKLVCTSGIIYSNTASGAIDRQAPIVFGLPEPTDRNLAPGDLISYTYDENIDVSNLAGKVQLYRMLNNTLIPSTVSGSGSKLVITPGINIMSWQGESVRVVVSNVSDVYGNTNTNADTSSFTIGTAPIVVGPVEPVKIYMVGNSLYENVNGTLIVRFKMNTIPKRNTIKANFSIGGTAEFNKDYTISMDTSKIKVYYDGIADIAKLNPAFDGSQGYLYIDSNKSEAMIRITPIKDAVYEPDETIIINLLAGGDYGIADSFSTTATILNDELAPPNIIPITGEINSCSGGQVVLKAIDPNQKTRWATSLIAVSSQYAANDWGGIQATGEPNVYPQYGDIPYAWSPTNPDNAKDSIELGYSNPEKINFIDIYETYNPGAIDAVYIKNATTGVYNRVYADLPPTVDTSQAQDARIFRITLPAITPYNVSAVRISLKSSAVLGYNEIDAVGIGLDTTYATYLWNTGATTSLITASNGGYYSVAAKDALGRNVTSKVYVGRTPTISGSATANPICFGGVGAIQLNTASTGNVVAYKYKLDTAAANKYQSSFVFKPLKAGTYKVNVMDSLGCEATSTNISITQPAAITGTFTKTDATCIGKADGTITVTTSGGKAPYGYKVGLGGNYNDSKTITGLKAGTYTIYVKDVNGCVGAVGPVTVGQANVACLSRTAIANATAQQEQTGLAVVLTPNPTNQQFTLRVFTERKEVVQLRVLDVNGRVLYTAKGAPEQAFKFGEAFPPATYLVEVRQGETVKTVKAVKLR